MYCRKCGKKIDDKAIFCDKCGEKVITVKQRSYSEKYNEKRKQEKSKYSKKKQENEELKNPYVFAAFITSVVATVLSFFPWPSSWSIGTSMWMRIVILVIALLSDYHSVKAHQVNNLYSKEYDYKVQPRMLSIATFLGVFITIIALFSIFNL
ncbi:MAG: zinc-ribbon domain-containing protein [Erysipelotrichaceae bacterium]|nr:zinc-ribbon domain-containing protein [Erysipelotrichaceae bacterium]